MASASYLADVRAAIQSVERTGGAPYAISPMRRVVYTACCPIACGACCFWSTLCRVLACPFQCACNGCAFACSNNACTDPSDAMLGAYWRSLHARVQLQTLSLGAFDSQDDLDALLSVIDEIIVTFRDADGIYTRAHYALAEAVVRPLTGEALGSMPAYASKHLGELRLRVAIKREASS